jgi:hypothetical protein
MRILSGGWETCSDAHWKIALAAGQEKPNMRMDEKKGSVPFSLGGSPITPPKMAARSELRRACDAHPSLQ